MRQRRTIWIAALCALLFSALVPRADAVWQCEGRTCGTTLWFCCCISPIDAQDGRCGTSTRPAAGAAACPTDCACVLTLQVVDAARPAATAGFSAPLFHPALLSTTPGAPLPLGLEVVARSIETRGPPSSPVALATPSLRAPPIS